MLINAIAESGKEDKYVVEKAKQYIDELLASGELVEYLKHNRDRLKAKFSSVISVINPEKSTTLFNVLLMSHEWEKKKEIQKHFKLIKEIFK